MKKLLVFAAIVLVVFLGAYLLFKGQAIPKEAITGVWVSEDQAFRLNLKGDNTFLIQSKGMVGLLHWAEKKLTGKSSEPRGTYKLVYKPFQGNHLIFTFDNGEIQDHTIRLREGKLIFSGQPLRRLPMP